MENTGTTGIVAHKLGRNYIGFDTNPEYLELTIKRLKGLDQNYPLSRYNSPALIASQHY